MNLLCKIIVLCLVTGVLTDEQNHIYEDNEEVNLWMHTVGPYHNPQETYPYFSLPFCRGTREALSRYYGTLSEGDEFEFSGFDIEFKVNIPKFQYCWIQLFDEKYQAFVYAVKNHYWYRMYIDDLPLWGMVGEVADSDYYIFTHQILEIGYNGKHIVDVNVTSEDKVLLTPNAKLIFSYEVIWKRSEVKFEDRLDKYLDSNLFQNRIHWFGIFSSLFMVIFIVGLVSMIFMTLRKDYACHSKDKNMDAFVYIIANSKEIQEKNAMEANNKSGLLKIRNKFIDFVKKLRKL